MYGIFSVCADCQGYPLSGRRVNIKPGISGTKRGKIQDSRAPRNWRKATAYNEDQSRVNHLRAIGLLLSGDIC